MRHIHLKWCHFFKEELRHEYIEYEGLSFTLVYRNCQCICMLIIQIATDQFFLVVAAMPTMVYIVRTESPWCYGKVAPKARNFVK